MKRFIHKLLLFILPIFIFIVFVSFLAGGYTDPFYVRFTTPKQKNLIIGTSRAAQGLQPEIFNKILNANIYNYAFSVTHSPFGKVYYESILKKHNKEKNGIFIITVDPWSISSWCKDPNDLNQFRENELCLNNTRYVNLYPNLEYLYKNLNGKYIDIILPPSKNMFLHNNGWLEVSGIPMDSASVNQRILDKIATYRTEYLPKTKFSQVRLDYLLQTVKYLKNYGKVFLVRLPVHRDMLEIEDKIMPDFNNVIEKAIALSDDYLDLTTKNDDFIYTDGNHLYKSSGKEVSELIANWIKKNL
ncbi:MAG: hypothetical protein IPM47_05465 [Sphingobacteriales bacterium]|nr:MAG: hypothetical protein IPM47_05465 [Sphingobacteriales bacterium]